MKNQYTDIDQLPAMFNRKQNSFLNMGLNNIYKRCTGNPLRGGQNKGCTTIELFPYKVQQHFKFAWNIVNITQQNNFSTRIIREIVPVNTGCFYIVETGVPDIFPQQLHCIVSIITNRYPPGNRRNTERRQPDTCSQFKNRFIFDQ